MRALQLLHDAALEHDGCPQNHLREQSGTKHGQIHLHAVRPKEILLAAAQMYTASGRFHGLGSVPCQRFLHHSFASVSAPGSTLSASVTRV